MTRLQDSLTQLAEAAEQIEIGLERGEPIESLKVSAGELKTALRAAAESAGGDEGDQ